MQRRSFLRSLFASSAAIVVAPADIFDVLPPAPGDPRRTYFDMGRNAIPDFPTIPDFPVSTPFFGMLLDYISRDYGPLNSGTWP